MRILSCSILMLIFNMSLRAQDSFVCGTVENVANLDKIYRYNQSNNFKIQKAQALKFVPIQVHSVGRDDSTGHITSDYVLQQICSLNEQFEAAGMYFYLYDDINKINNSNYYEHNYTSGLQMMNFNKVTGVLNIFIASNVGDNVGGYYSPSQDAIAVRIDLTGFGKKVWVHEVGHYFYLPHTFNGLSGGTNELVDGSNCASAGDGFCDTPADPNNFSWNCPYSGITTDANGDTYNPDATLFMSYAARSCVNRFSTEQASYMNAILNTSKSFLLAHPMPDTTEVIGSITAFSPFSEETDVTYNVNFSWNKVIGAEKYNLLVSKSIIFIPGINLVDETVTDTFLQVELSPDDFYFWKAIPFKNGNTCTPFTSGTRFFTGFDSGINTNINTSVAEINFLNDAITIFPNPIDNECFYLNVLSPTDASLTVLVYDVLGKMNTIEKISVLRGVKKQTKIDLSSSSSGVFFVNIIDDKGNAMYEKIIRH